ncbi:VPS10 domain-containing protein [Portibacter marinus]|uniref:VPS10 domain-containing protein n=1 Tax=Portibacter marinus TaxID=2898660 RepID=UPI001F47661D|nr:glycosyl hydrolase [Portibacter marinus]
MKELLTIMLVLALTFNLNAQKNKKKEEVEKEKKEAIDTMNLSGLKWRCIGPALTSGRISDFAVNPDNPFEYYIAVSSGGVWKTINNGTTFTPLFDGEGSYSIGCITMDPGNHNVIWVGTGENNNQRSVAYGDGVYKSTDGGESWKNMGLKTSEHIGKIIVHPENSDIVYVAAIGPLWSKGGERGVYKTLDGGETWELVLEIDEHTGVSDIVIDPRNPDVLYASALQRRRHVYTYVGGGPGSGLYKTTDGGDNWSEINKGLPSVELGRIGLEISPADPEVIYAIVEAADGKGGVFRSMNRGASWEKRSGYTSSGNYYQEIIADPHDVNTLFSMNTWFQVSRDGGKTWNNAGEDTKHVDNHCMWIDPNNTDHWLLGCDGGIYETFDAAKTWDFKPNLPVTQFYKVAVDNDEPFYNVYGGTQDNFSLGGPSRTLTNHGIMNSDWFITNGGDGFESQVDPQNPDIVYAQSQYGNLVRYDRKSGESVGIQPKERKGENEYKWNWDAPLIASPHSEGRVYFAANKVFKSDDYGNSWEVISDDLSRGLNRNELKVYDRVLSIDAVMKNGSTSQYGTIVAMAESTLNENLLAVGTDDGLIHVTEDGGSSWNKIDGISGAPKQSYVNAIYLSNHDENVIYAAYNHHKYGDFKPYLFRSSDKGKTWKNIGSDLPERGSVYAIEEDHEDADLIFCGTEFGVYFSPDAGGVWKKLGSGLPTIAVRDIAIQRRENDLVLGTFGRGFYVLDDYSALREIENDEPSELATIFPVRDALQWVPSSPLGLPGKSFQGDGFYTADNLGPEALIRYYYSEEEKSLEDKRKEREKELIKAGQDVRYPTYEEYKAENEELPTHLLFVIKDADGNLIRQIEKKPSKGVGSLSWDLRLPARDAIDLSSPSFYNPFAGESQGALAEPGTYSVTMYLNKDGQISELNGPVSFEVKALEGHVMPAKDRGEKLAFQEKVNVLRAEIETVGQMISEMNKKVRYMKEAIKVADVPIGELQEPLLDLEEALRSVSQEMYGDRLKRSLDIDQPVTPAQRIGSIAWEQGSSTAEPTRTHIDSYEIAKAEFKPIQEKVKKLYTEDIVEMEETLKRIGAPYTPGRVLGH